VDLPQSGPGLFGQNHEWGGRPAGADVQADQLADLEQTVHEDLQFDGRGPLRLGGHRGVDLVYEGHRPAHGRLGHESDGQPLRQQAQLLHLHQSVRLQRPNPNKVQLGQLGLEQVSTQQGHGGTVRPRPEHQHSQETLHHLKE